MTEYTANNSSEMLNLLIDGELDSTMETQLYASLLANEDLRTELRELITIREAVRKDTEAFALPTGATQNVFSKLGFSPIGSVGTTATQNVISNPWYKKLWNPIVTAIVASILTALFFLNTNNEFNSGQKFAYNSLNNLDAKTEQSSIAPEVIQTITNDVSTNESHQSIASNSNRIKSKSNNENISSGNNYLKSLPISLDNSQISRNSFTKSSLDNNNFFDFNNVRNTEEISNLANTHQREFLIKDNYYPAYKQNHSLTLCLNGISAVSFPNVNIESQSSLLSNISFGGYIPISKNFNIGLEVGQETFGQIFYNIENNSAVKYRQNPKLLWGGMGVNYTFDNYLFEIANAQPFLHFTLASTSLGPFGKAVSGVQFISDNGFGFNFGLQASVLVYQNEKRFYSTEKFGFIYGMFMRF